MPKSSSPLPTDLADAARRFAEWRRHRTRRAIPGELWATAADLASRHGVSRTARALRVQYYDLRKRVLAAPAPTPAPAGTALPSFVEILTAPAVSGSEVVIEIENGSGAKMRIRLQSVDAPILADLSRAFLGVGA